MGTSTQISEFQKGAILALRDVGKSLREFGAYVGIHHTTVSKFLKTYDETGSFEVVPRIGRPRSSTPAQDNVLENLCLGNRKASTSELNRRWKRATRNRV